MDLFVFFFKVSWFVVVRFTVLLFVYVYLCGFLIPRRQYSFSKHHWGKDTNYTKENTCIEAIAIQYYKYRVGINMDLCNRKKERIQRVFFWSSIYRKVSSSLMLYVLALYLWVYVCSFSLSVYHDFHLHESNMSFKHIPNQKYTIL